MKKFICRHSRGSNRKSIVFKNKESWIPAPRLRTSGAGFAGMTAKNTPTYVKKRWRHYNSSNLCDSETILKQVQHMVRNDNLITDSILATKSNKDAIRQITDFIHLLLIQRVTLSGNLPCSQGILPEGGFLYRGLKLNKVKRILYSKETLFTSLCHSRLSGIFLKSCTLLGRLRKDSGQARMTYLIHRCGLHIYFLVKDKQVIHV